MHQGTVHDESVACISHGLRDIRDSRMESIDIPRRDDHDDDDIFDADEHNKKSKGNPYAE